MELPPLLASDFCQRLLSGATAAEISTRLKDAGVSKLGHRTSVLQQLQSRSQREAAQVREALAPLGISPVSDVACGALLAAAGDHQHILAVLREAVGVKRMGLRQRAMSALLQSIGSASLAPVPAVEQLDTGPSCEPLQGVGIHDASPAPSVATGSCERRPVASQHGPLRRHELTPSEEAAGMLQLALPLLTQEQLEDIQFQACAEDVPIDFEQMAHWADEEARDYFESGGRHPPIDISDALAGGARRAPLALFWYGMLSHPRFRACRALTHRHRVYRIPALVRTPSALLAFAEARESSDDSGMIDLVCRRSTDGGQTWGDVHLVPAHEPHAPHGPAAAEETVGNPVPIFNPRTSELLLLFCSNASREGEEAIRSGGEGIVGRRVWLLHSSDEGLTWSRRRELTAEVKRQGWTWYATGPGGGVVLTDGTLAVPATHADGVGPIGGGGDHSHVLLSDDDGETWHVGGDGWTHTNEATIAQISDGSLLLNARSLAPNGLRTLQRSSDGGKTWGATWTCDQLREPPPLGCHGSMVATPGGRALFFAGLDVPASTQATAWQHGAGGRQRLGVRRSDDDGRRWDSGVLLHAGPAGYSSLCLLDGERSVGGAGNVLGVLYERGEEPSAFFAQSIVFELLHDEHLLGAWAKGRDGQEARRAVLHDNTNARPLDVAAAYSEPAAPFEVELGPLPGEVARGPSSGPPLRYRPRHPELFLVEGAPFRDEWLVGAVVSALKAAEAVDTSGGESPAKRRAQRGLRQLMQEELAGRVYSLDLLTPAFCEMLVAEVEHYEASGLPSHRPNTMNNYGLILNQIGLRPMLTALQRRVVLPLSSMLFPAEGSAFTEHYSFVCQYKVDQDTHLDSASAGLDPATSGRSYCAAPLSCLLTQRSPDRDAPLSCLLTQRSPDRDAPPQCTTMTVMSPSMCALARSLAARRSPSAARSLTMTRTASTRTRTHISAAAPCSTWGHTAMARTQSRGESATRSFSGARGRFARPKGSSWAMQSACSAAPKGTRRISSASRTRTIPISASSNRTRTARRPIRLRAGAISTASARPRRRAAPRTCGRAARTTFDGGTGARLRPSMRAPPSTRRTRGARPSRARCARCCSTRRKRG